MSTPVQPKSEASSAPALLILAIAAVAATAFGFVLRSIVINDWGVEFGLSQTQKGELLGVGLWPFSVSVVLFSFVVDRTGFRFTLLFAFGCHILSTFLTVMAVGYWSLYWGTFLFSLGSGAVEAAANPLVATLYRDNKAKWLNMLHSGWPLGQVVGGLLALSLGVGVNWRVKVGLVVLPTVLYGGLLVGRRFPPTERLSAGVSYREMLCEAGAMAFFVVATLIIVELGRDFSLSFAAQAFAILAITAMVGLVLRSPGRPLFLAFILLMIPLATTELGTDSWITSLMGPQMRAIGLQAGWIIVFTSFITWALRVSAGPLIHRWSALGLLAASCVLTSTGLIAMSAAPGAWLLAAAALFGLGKAFFWGTSLGVVAEQFPRGGPVTLNFTAGVGMLAAGIVGSSGLGAIQDRSIEHNLHQRDAVAGSRFADELLGAPHRGVFGEQRGIDDAKLATAAPATRALVEPIVDDAKRSVLRWVSLLPMGMLFAYLVLIIWFRRQGGYRPAVITASVTGVDPRDRATL